MFKGVRERLARRARPAARGLRDAEAEAAGDAADRGDRAAHRRAARAPGSRSSCAAPKSLEDAIRRAGRRIALAFASGAALLAAVLAAAADSIEIWVPITLGGRRAGLGGRLRSRSTCFAAPLADAEPPLDHEGEERHQRTDHDALDRAEET